MPAARVLVADDQLDIVDAVALALKSIGFETDSATSVAAVHEQLLARRYDLLLMDLNYARDTTSGREGLELLSVVHDRDPLLPIIVMTGWGTIETAVEAMRRGARTFIHKPWDNATLVRTVTREIEDGRARRTAGALAKRQHDDARLIQRALLPASLPTVGGCEIAAIWQPASDFGGDCYDARALGGNSIGVSIADVCGKGLPAAFLMSNLQASVRAFATTHADPGEVAASVNRALCGNAALHTFATFFYGVIDCDARTLTFANAGHNAPVLVRADGSVDRLTTGGVVLGIFEDARYERRQVRVETGDRLVLFTDGVTDAERADGTEFGDDRLVEAAVMHRSEPAAQLCDSILGRVRGFTGGSFGDDATLISIAVHS